MLWRTAIVFSGWPRDCQEAFTIEFFKFTQVQWRPERQGTRKGEEFFTSRWNNLCQCPLASQSGQEFFTLWLERNNLCQRPSQSGQESFTPPSRWDKWNFFQHPCILSVTIWKEMAVMITGKNLTVTLVTAAAADFRQISEGCGSQGKKGPFMLEFQHPDTWLMLKN